MDTPNLKIVKFVPKNEKEQIEYKESLMRVAADLFKSVETSEINGFVTIGITTDGSNAVKWQCFAPGVKDDEVIGMLETAKALIIKNKFR